MKKYLSITVLLLIASTAIAQMHDNIWHQGGGVKSKGGGLMQIDFKDTQHPEYKIVADTIGAIKGNSTICDSLGNLLFYSNGKNIYTKEFEIMQNGERITGDGHFMGTNDHQGVLIIPCVGNSYEYFVFTTEERLIGNQYFAKLFMHRVDMSYNNGLGKVVEKRRLINDANLLDAGLAAVKHANGRDWWLLAHEAYTNIYYSHLISKDTIKTYQFTQDAIFQKLGYYQFSQDGEHYFMVDGIRFLEPTICTKFDFDRCTGKLSNSKQTLIPALNYYLLSGGATSPDSRYYYTFIDTTVRQYDLEASDFFASEKIVATADGTAFYYTPKNFSFGQLAPDGKIYITNYGSTNSFHRIEFPNREGLASQVIPNRINIPNIAYDEFPNHPNYRLGPIDGSPCDTLGIDNHPLARWRYDQELEQNLLRVSFTDLSDYVPSTWYWDFGDGNSSTEKDPIHTYPSPNIYQACLIVCNANSCDTLCKEIDLLTPATHPIANFSYLQNPTAIQFTDLSTDSDWVTWNFGHDSLSGNLNNYQNPLHTFPDTGVYHVCQIACVPTECDTFCQDIHVTETLEIPVQAGFTYQRPNPWIILLKNTTICDITPTYQWDFGDPSLGADNYSALEDPLPFYFQDGVYKVCLTACSTNRCDTFCDYVVYGLIELPVVANFSYALQGQTVLFSDQSQSDMSTSWHWTFGDGQSSTDQNPSHQYASAGIYQVCLIACTPTHCDTICQTISIENVPIFPITANFSYANTSDYEVTFTDESQSDSIISWLWTFGDGQSSTAQNPSHQYASAGTYTVCLIACTPTHCDTFCQEVVLEEIIPPFFANFGFVITNSNEVTFQDQSQTNPISWSWNFGDGTTSTAQSPQHIYTQIGTYTTCLVACNAAGLCDTFCLDVVIETVGLEEHTSKLEENLYTIFPNPVQQEVYIYPKHKQNTSNVIFSLYDITGRAVFTEKLSKNQAFWKINLGSLVEGLYFYAIKNESGEMLAVGKLVRE